MNKINQFIDLCLIDEYARKDFIKGYSLNIRDIPSYDLSNLIDKLVKNDDVTKQFIRDRINELFEERLAKRELKDRADANLSLIHLSNGDVQLVRGAAC